ncbi:hypothetical protein N7519_006046 [Penicillium mononematosum]|uniref:uncharacterized protein n=1 Tax=Penicillium mononematosum TaxID=268346 RepID=UPI002549405D|nr:uncharacterized protein N7519_006046 [Penicillium mononematosum]KAJ6184745.1 hypothetical protein N7519_006046 [Penicillium mononematosum]
MATRTPRYLSQEQTSQRPAPRRRKWAPKSKSGIRRVKCDEEKPHCRRCVSTGRKCDGFVEHLRYSPPQCEEHQHLDLFGLTHDNIPPTGLPSRDYHACWRPLIESLPPRAVARRCMHIGERAEGFPLQYPLAESWNDHCLPLVMNKFLFDMAKSVYNAIPCVISKAHERSALYLVCNAVGFAYMANAHRSLDTAINRSRAYGAALAAIHSAVRGPQQCKSDDTLLGVWLLSLYEVRHGSQRLSGLRFTDTHAMKLLLGARESVNPVAKYSGWDIHSRGLIELIRLGGTERFARRDGRNVFWIVFNTVQIQALLTGQECPKESCTWIRDVYRHCDLSEHTVVRASIFAYHCSHICSRIRRLVSIGDLDKLLSSSTSILRDIDGVEKATYPLSHERPLTDCVIDPPLTPYTAPARIDLRYVGVYTYQSNCRMQLACNAREFLLHASRAAACTPQQRIIFTQYQNRCVEEFRAVANKVLFVMTMVLDIDSLTIFDQLKGPGRVTNLSRIVDWPDAIRVLWPVVQWPLRLIAACHLSLDWQRSAANEILNSMNEQLGIMRSLGTLYFSGMHVP